MGAPGKSEDGREASAAGADAGSETVKNGACSRRCEQGITDRQWLEGQVGAVSLAESNGNRAMALDGGHRRAFRGATAAVDLSLKCQSRRGDRKDGQQTIGSAARPSVLAPGSALRSVPTVALSSAQVMAHPNVRAAVRKPNNWLPYRRASGPLPDRHQEQDETVNEKKNCQPVRTLSHSAIGALDFPLHSRGDRP